MLGNLMHLVHYKLWLEVAREMDFEAVGKAVLPEEVGAARQALAKTTRARLAEVGLKVFGYLTRIQTGTGEEAVDAAFRDIQRARSHFEQMLEVLDAGAELENLAESRGELHRLSDEITRDLRSASPEIPDADQRGRVELEEALNKYVRPVLLAEDEAARRFEDLLLRHGDTGLLEQLVYAVRSEDERTLDGSIHALATRLMNRRLYKSAAYSKGGRALADTIWSRYREPSTRLDLTRRVAAALSEYRGVDVAYWKIALWVPSPTMKLKPADVLVFDGDSVSTLQDRDQAGAGRGREIYDSHRALWAVQVFVEDRLSDGEFGVLAGVLRECLDMEFGMGRSVPEISPTDDIGPSEDGSISQLPTATASEERIAARAAPDTSAKEIQKAARSARRAPPKPSAS
jgi:hypothetical protein